jgi:hypothetical protein
MYNWFLQGKNIHNATYSFESPDKVNIRMDGCHFC